MKWTKEARYRPYSMMTEEEKTALTETVAHSPWRQTFHIQPPTGLLNDPNGFSYYDGMYHLFYQWFPYGAVHGLKHWYHVVSKDLATWTEQGLAIEPDLPHESHGAYSGSGFVHDNKLHLLYTGNQRTDEWERVPNQALAVMNSDWSIEKRPLPLIANSPEGYTEHFRDPKVWKDGDTFYFVIGAQRDSLTGCALLYKSSDVLNWELVSEISTTYADFGYMWECPDYFELDGKGILVFSPQGVEAEGTHYQNIYQTGYLIGSPLDLKTGEFQHGPFHELDAGFDFYAPQSTEAKDGRRIVIGWMGLPDIEYPSDRYNWAHCLTLPREVTLADGKLIQKPVQELEKRRGKGTPFQHSNGETTLDAGTTYEIKLEFSSIESLNYGIRLRTSETEQTTLTFDQTKNMLTLDRSKSGEVPAQAYGTTRSVSLDGEKLTSLQLFVDTSSVEIFANNGQVVFTSRIFPQEESTGFQTFAKQGTVNVTGTHWTIS